MKKQFRILAAALALCLSLLCCPAAFAAVDSSSCQTVPYAQATSQPLGQPITITGTPNYSAATSNDTAFIFGFDTADGVWQQTFKVRPEPLTRDEKKAWISTMKDVSLGSDAFFPFGDNVERARKSGVQYIVQPGGSIRDDHVIATCDKYGIVMAFTGMRLFHH